MIKNIVLDMGNVLLDFTPDISLQKFIDNVSDREIIRRELFQGSEWIQGDLGKITNSERFDSVSRRIPMRLHSALKQCVEHWDICMEPIPGAKEFCSYTKEKGYGIYILSNACNKFYEYFPKNFLPLEYFDGVVVSSDIHIIKPDPRIYDYLLQTYKLKAEECLFIDDRAENVEAAKQVGMQAEVFTGEFTYIKDTYLRQLKKKKHLTFLCSQ